MTESWARGDWLLVDAAGPGLVTGLLRNGHWLDHSRTEGGFLESLQPAVQDLLDQNGIRLADLNGVLHAEGPGSTLGLRLAAMFLRSLMETPALCGWRCLQYNNLALAAAERTDPAAPQPVQLGAPWRRDRIHRVTVRPGPPVAFDLDAAHPGNVMSSSLQMVELGRRPANLPEGAGVIPYPWEKIPEVLKAFPDLLESRDRPGLYQVEAPAFAKWSPERHVAP